MNFYALEPVLVNRLKAACPDIYTVEALPDLFALYGNESLFPSKTSAGRSGAAFVIYWDEAVTEARKDCDRAAQTWLVAVVSKRHDKMRTGETARQDNGVLVDQVLQALRGWDYGADLSAATGQPSNMRRFLKRVSVPVNRHQFPPDVTGIVTTLLGYEAPNLIV